MDPVMDPASTLTPDMGSGLCYSFSLWGQTEGASLHQSNSADWFTGPQDFKTTWGAAVKQYWNGWNFNNLQSILLKKQPKKKKLLQQRKAYWEQIPWHAEVLWMQATHPHAQETQPAQSKASLPGMALEAFNFNLKLTNLSVNADISASVQRCICVGQNSQCRVSTARLPGLPAVVTSSDCSSFLPGNWHACPSRALLPVCWETVLPSKHTCQSHSSPGQKTLIALSTPKGPGLSKGLKGVTHPSPTDSQTPLHPLTDPTAWKLTL